VILCRSSLAVIVFLTLGFAGAALGDSGAAPETESGDAAVVPDEIVLKNGSRLLGKVTGVRDASVNFSTDFAGELTIDMDQVESISTQSPVVMQLADKTVVREVPLQVEQSEVVIAAGDGMGERKLALDELLLVNPEPWELGEGYKWSGQTSFAWALERGNTDTDELDIFFESIWRSVLDRYTLKLTSEQDEVNGQRSADNWLLSGKYDYFISDGRYWGIFASAESDEFTDLDLRYLLGPVYGRDFRDDSLLALSAEVGVAYVNENFIVAEDQDYVSGIWNLKMSSDYLGADSRLYLTQRGILSLDDISDLVIDTTVGLAFPLRWGLEASAELLLEYDSGAPAGVEDLDQTYKVRIGYSW